MMVPEVSDIDEQLSEENARAVLIAEQNDRFRKRLGLCPGISGRIMHTQGVAHLGRAVIEQLLAALVAFEDFSEDNDPFGQHDFGIIILDGVSVYWKIDLYDASYEFGSETPEDPEVTRRVLTLLLPSEY